MLWPLCLCFLLFSVKSSCYDCDHTIDQLPLQLAKQAQNTYNFCVQKWKMQEGALNKRNNFFFNAEFMPKDKPVISPAVRPVQSQDGHGNGCEPSSNIKLRKNCLTNFFSRPPTVRGPWTTVPKGHASIRH